MDAVMFMGNKSLLLILLLSAAPVAVATIVGLIIGLFQTVTQLQEQTLRRSQLRRTTTRVPAHTRQARLSRRTA